MGLSNPGPASSDDLRCGGGASQGQPPVFNSLEGAWPVFWEYGTGWDNPQHPVPASLWSAIPQVSGQANPIRTCPTAAVPYEVRWDTVGTVSRPELAIPVMDGEWLPDLFDRSQMSCRSSVT